MQKQINNIPIQNSISNIKRNKNQIPINKPDKTNKTEKYIQTKRFKQIKRHGKTGNRLTANMVALTNRLQAYSKHDSIDKQITANMVALAN